MVWPWRCLQSEMRCSYSAASRAGVDWLLAIISSISGTQFPHFGRDWQALNTQAALRTPGWAAASASSRSRRALQMQMYMSF